MNLSKSKYCNGVQCKKMLWLDKYKPEEKEEINNQSVFDNGNDVHEVARKLFGEDINIAFNEDLSQMIKDTEKALKNENAIITEASFNYNNNFCSVDILKKEGNNYEIYEVKSSTHLKDVFINDASYQYYVLTSLGLKVTKCYVVTLNKDYANYLLICDLCSEIYEDTIVNEIKMLDRSAFVEIDKSNRSLKIDYIDYSENAVELGSDECFDILDNWYNRWTSIIKNLKIE